MTSTNTSQTTADALTVKKFTIGKTYFDAWKLTFTVTSRTDDTITVIPTEETCSRFSIKADPSTHSVKTNRDINAEIAYCAVEGYEWRIVFTALNEVIPEQSRAAEHDYEVMLIDEDYYSPDCEPMTAALDDIPEPRLDNVETQQVSPMQAFRDKLRATKTEAEFRHVLAVTPFKMLREFCSQMYGHIEKHASRVSLSARITQSEAPKTIWHWWHLMKIIKQSKGVKAANGTQSAGSTKAQSKPQNKTCNEPIKTHDRTAKKTLSSDLITVQDIINMAKGRDLQDVLMGFSDKKLRDFADHHRIALKPQWKKDFACWFCVAALSVCSERYYD